MLLSSFSLSTFDNIVKVALNDDDVMAGRCPISTSEDEEVFEASNVALGTVAQVVRRFRERQTRQSIMFQ